MGEWNGKLGPLAVVFRFEIKENGDFTRFLDSPMQGTSGIPITDASFTDGQLKLKVKGSMESLRGNCQATALPVIGHRWEELIP